MLQRKFRPRGLLTEPALLAAVAILLAVVALWRALLNRERVELERTTGLVAETVKNRIRSELAIRVLPLERLARRWEIRRYSSREEWEAEAGLFASAYTGYQAIQWLDPSYKVRWFAPAGGNEIYEEYNYALDNSVRPALDTARRKRAVAATGSLRLLTGGQGFVVLVPVFRAGQLGGFIAGVFRTTELLEFTLAEPVPAGYSVTVLDGDQPLYTRQRDEYNPGRWAAEQQVALHGLNWRVRVSPRGESLLETRTTLPGLVLGAGVILSVLIGLIVYFAEHARSAAEALRRANETLRAVIEASPLAIVSMDLEGNVKSWNRAAERTFGWTEAEVLNRPFPIVPAEDMEFFRTNMNRARRGETIAGIERRRRTKDGSLIDVGLWTAVLRNARGQSVGVISVIADITERKRLEEQLRESQKMEAVGRLAGGIAHDFNNLLTVITGYSHLVIDSQPEGSPLRLEVENILKAAERAAGLTNELLAFGRRQIAQPRRLDLNQLVPELEEVIRKLVGDRIEVRCSLCEGQTPVRIDPVQFEQVLMNLTLNARDAMPRGGSLEIRTDRVELSEYRQAFPDLRAGSYVVLSVRDTGAGIDEETRRHLFEPFFTTKALGQGSGLGLSSVYGIVKQNGGEISVSSEPGRGARFDIYLPRDL